MVTKVLGPGASSNKGEAPLRTAECSRELLASKTDVQEWLLSRGQEALIADSVPLIELN